MRKLMMMLWLVVPIGLVAYHYGPGQVRLARDRAARHLATARAAEAREDWQAALAGYRSALDELPASDVDARLTTRLAHAKVRQFVGELPEAMADVEALLDDALRDSHNTALQDQIRATAGTMHYYLAWLMRLEGADTDEWTEQTEIARQHFRLLAEDASAVGNASAESHEKNLEAVIRLARMDLSELKGLPLPKECQGNCNCSGKCRSQKQARTKTPKKPNDAREQIMQEKKDSAGMNDRPGGGS
jgi:hypothetical protein